MILTNAQAVVDHINATTDDYRAYLDPSEALHNRPCFLVTPPVLDYNAGTLDGSVQVTVRLIALSSYRSGDAGLEAMTELDALLTTATAAAPLTVERAEPSSYSLSTTERVACYVLTIT